ncbi:MAG: hypothetical protein AAFP04_12125 [Myxococcota bacterium]
MSDTQTLRSWVAARCGPFQIAIAARSVLAIEELTGAPLEHAFPIVDLVARWKPEGSTRGGFVIQVEVRSRSLGLKVEQVSQFSDHARLIPLPAFGLDAPELFAGVLRRAGQSYFILRPDALTPDAR